MGCRGVGRGRGGLRAGGGGEVRRHLRSAGGVAVKVDNTRRRAVGRCLAPHTRLQLVSTGVGHLKIFAPELCVAVYKARRPELAWIVLCTRRADDALDHLLIPIPQQVPVPHQTQPRSTHARLARLGRLSALRRRRPVRACRAGAGCGGLAGGARGGARATLSWWTRAGGVTR